MDSRLDNRYIVIKNKDLTSWQHKTLNAVIQANGILPIDAVVVESDWPLYPQVVEAVLNGAEPIRPDDPPLPPPINKLNIKAPYQLKPLTEEQENHVLNGLRRLNKGEPESDQLRRSSKVMQIRLADRDWLTNNLPFGTVFEYLGLTAMAIGHEFISIGHQFDKHWVAKLHVVSGGKLELLQYTVPQLRAILEPGYLNVEPQE